MEGIKRRQICEKVLPAALDADQDTKGDDAVTSWHVLPTAEIGNGHDPLFPHRREQRCHHAAVNGARDIVMLEGKRIGILFGFIKNK